MSELCIYGGLLATRAEVYFDIKACAKSNGHNLSDLFVDKMVWMNPKATPAQIKLMKSRNHTLKAMRAA